MAAKHRDAYPCAVVGVDVAAGVARSPNLTAGLRSNIGKVSGVYV